MTKQYDKEFKENAVQYRYDHPELTVKECAKNTGCATHKMLLKCKKSHRYSGKITETIYQTVSEFTEAAKRRVSVSGILKKPAFHIRVTGRGGSVNHRLWSFAEIA